MNKIVFYPLPGVKIIAARADRKPSPAGDTAGRLQLHRWQQNLKKRLLADEGLPENPPHTPDGKPYLPDGSYLSVSHSGNMVAVALSPSMPVGIDVQVFQPKTLRVVRRIMHPSENDLPLTDETAHWLWCAKEAVYKACEKNGLSLRENIRIKWHENLPFEAVVHDGNTTIFRLFPARWDDYFMVTAVGKTS